MVRVCRTFAGGVPPSVCCAALTSGQAGERPVGVQVLGHLLPKTLERPARTKSQWGEMIKTTDVCWTTTSLRDAAGEVDAGQVS